MSRPAAPMSSQGQARLAGALYLYIVVAGVFAEAVVRGPLIHWDDPAATTAAILGSEGLFRAGLALELVLHLCDLGVAVLLYGLFRPAAPGLSLFAALLRVVVTAIAGVRSLLMYAPLAINREGGMASFTNGQRDELTILALQLHDAAYSVSLVFFGVCCLALGGLILRSRLMPGVLGAMMALAGVCYLVNSFAGMLAPSLSGVLFPWILLPCLVAELALALWLLVFGVRRLEGSAA